MSVLAFAFATGIGLLVDGTLAVGAPLNTTLDLPPYTASAAQAFEAGIPAYEGLLSPGSQGMNAAVVQAQARQCRRDLQYAAQARGATQAETFWQRQFWPQSVYDLPGFGHVPFCPWYPQWRLRRLWGPNDGRSIAWPGPPK